MITYSTVNLYLKDKLLAELDIVCTIDGNTLKDKETALYRAQRVYFKGATVGKGKYEVKLKKILKKLG